MLSLLGFALRRPLLTGLGIAALSLLAAWGWVSFTGAASDRALRRAHAQTAQWRDAATARYAVIAELEQTNARQAERFRTALNAERAARTAAEQEASRERTAARTATDALTEARTDDPTFDACMAAPLPDGLADRLHGDSAP